MDPNRPIIEAMLARHVATMLRFLPAIDACDAWTLTTSTKGGRTVWSFELACTERREAGRSNHARADLFWTGRNLRVRWTHGQGHLYPESPGACRSFRLGGKNLLGMGRAFRHIEKFAKADADIFVVQ